MSRKIAVCFVLLVAACRPGPDAVPATSTTSAMSDTTTTRAAPAPASTGSTTPATRSTTTSSSTTTTTTAPPRLDRSAEAVTARLSSDLAALLANGPRVAGSEAEATASAHVATVLGQLGAITVDFVDLPNGLRTRNVRTTFGDGSVHLLLGAHIDSVPGSPGADDNASGVIVLLELARRFAEDPPPVMVTIVAFGAEERLSGYSRYAHHYGSRALAARLDEAGALPDRMISVDMVGFDDSLRAVVYRGTDRSTAAMLAEAGATLGTTIRVESRGDISDHEAFARRGVPAAFLWRPDNPGYHGPEDDTVDPDHLLENLAVLETFVNAMAAADS